MNRILTAAFVVLVGTATASAALVPEPVVELTGGGTSGLTIRAELPSALEITASEESLGMSLIFRDDEFAVPVVTRFIAVPDGSLPSLKLNGRTSRTIDSAGNPVGNVGQMEAVRPDLWPPEAVALGRVEIYRGVPVVPIAFYPLQIAADGSGIENNDLEVTVEFSPDPTAPYVRPIKDLAGSASARLIDDFLLNPPDRDPPEQQGEFLEHILIIYSTDLAGAGFQWIDTLATWKRQMGYMVSIQAYNPGSGVDVIRAGIRRDYYFNEDLPPISHLIIIGSSGDYGQVAALFPTERTQGDHYFSLMDDRDQLFSDITVGRIYVTSLVELAGAIKRTVLYEREPFVQNGTEWFRHALYTAENILVPGAQFVPSMIQLGRWIWYRWNYDMGYNLIDTVYIADQGEGQHAAVGRILDQRVGVSIAISRGWLTGAVPDTDPIITVDTGRKNPFVSAITCLSWDLGTKFFFTTTAARPKGPVASLAIWGLTHSKTNNCLMAQQIRAMRDYDYVQPGLIQNFSKMQLIGDYAWAQQEDQLEAAVLLNIYRLMGDPTVNIFTDVPIEFDVEHPASLEPGTTGLNIEVAQEGRDASNAVVCISQEDGVHLVASPGEDGVARFTFPEGLDSIPMTLTISAPNSIPYIVMIPVEESNGSLIMSEFDLSGDIIAGSSIDAAVTIANQGNAAVNNVVLNISSESPWVSFSPEQVNIGNIAANGSREPTFDIVINRSAPDSEIVRVDLRLTSGQNTWTEAFEFDILAANLYISDFGLVQGDRIDRGESPRFRPILTNGGRSGSAIVDAQLVSLNPDLCEVVRGAVEFAATNPGDNRVANTQLQIRIDSVAIPGTTAPFQLLLSARGNDAFRDTIDVSLTIGHKTATDPCGPDSYGYLCFDSFDEDWAKRPRYDWREINGGLDDREFEGTWLGFVDWKEDEDTSTVVELPFEFQYYGEVFDHIVVCSNGWIAFGEDKSLFVDFRNTRIPGVLGPDAMVAPYWDDFIVTNLVDEWGVYTHYVEGEGIFIIEWSKAQVLSDANLMEFQVILYDPDIRPTSTGDGEIKFQYKHVVPEAQGKSTDNRWATIGIRNLDGTDGIEYDYSFKPENELADAGARRVEDGMAILFTPDVELQTGDVSGQATLAERPEDPIEGVSVVVAGGGAAVTDADGMYSIVGIPVGQYSVTFTKDNYSIGRVDGVVVRNGEVTEVNIRMTHPTAVINGNRLVSVEIAPDNGYDSVLPVRNDGNGELTFRVSRRYENGAIPTIPQVLSRDLRPLARTPEYTNFLGLEIVDDTLFIAYGDSEIAEDNRIFVLNKQGALVRSFRQPSISGSGIKDLAWDGQFLYGGEDSLIYRFDVFGNNVSSIRIPVYNDDANAQDSLQSPLALAWNPDHETLLMANSYSQVFEMTLEGEIINTFRIAVPRHSSDIRALAWNPGDDDGMPIYALQFNPPDGRNRHVWLTKSSYNETREVKQLASQDNQRGYGLAIGFDWDRFKTIAATIVQQGVSDSVKFYEIGPDVRGITFDRSLQHVPAGSTLNFPFRFQSPGMKDGDYNFSIVVLHNAVGDSVRVPVTVNVRGDAAVGEVELIPNDLILEGAFPNPFNSTTRIRYSLPFAGPARLALYDITGREAIKLVEGDLKAGRHEVLVDANELGSGIYFARLEAAGTSRVVRLLLLK